MKHLQTLGVILLFLGLGFYLSLLFRHSYSLSESSVKTALNDEQQYELFIQTNGKDFINLQHKNKFEFLSKLKDEIKNTNEIVKQQFSIKPADLSKIADKTVRNNGVYQINEAKKIFRLEEQQQLLGDFTSWLDGEKFENAAALMEKLQPAVANANAAIIGKYGISSGKDQLKQFCLSAVNGIAVRNSWLVFFLSFGISILGSMLYILPKLTKHAGIKNNQLTTNGLKSQGIAGIILGTFLILAYFLLYWAPQYLTEWIIMLDPMAVFLSGGHASEWFMYGFIYCLAVGIMGIRFMIHYRHNSYHLLRTASVMFFQICIAFILAHILMLLNAPYMDFKNIWPLDYSFFFEWRIQEYIQAGTIGYFMLFWGLTLIIVGVPLFTFLFGKRWYCSWVCGCGGLAETAGDPFRHLSSKKLFAWKIERVLIHLVLVFAVVMTAGVIYTYLSGKSNILGLSTYDIRAVYGFAIGAVFAGVVGVGFYPLMGNRVWCRFGCPLAAYLGIIQRFRSRFRITSNGAQCISCGNCSTYCEMGIDVRWYAQRQQDIVRASCVGCGVCAAVCPRGVLKLENGPVSSRKTLPPIEITGQGIKVS